ncbi:MAG: permease [Candidatus Margulisbacteria bacterium]|nr:permease [Candidatus Margulisiibacteriota bacterium]MBU1617547.1 permease [Candidatus Margulisiibacteriota bacterium]MBU1867213.1 permease [Candidatus Margulisiibacteriota bacterium]
MTGKNHLKAYFWAVLFAIFIIGSLALSFDPGLKIYANFSEFFLEMITFLPLMFLLVGLFDVWIPKEKIEKHIGHGSGIGGTLWVILLATLQAGPLYGAFPVAYILSQKGASVRNIFIYLGVFSAMKLPMLTFEIGFLGLKFSILRTLFSLPVFIAIGFIMERYLDKDYKVTA